MSVPSCKELILEFHWGKVRNPGRLDNLKYVVNLEMNRNREEVKSMNRFFSMAIAISIAVFALFVGSAFAQAGGGGMGGGGMGGGGMGGGGMGGGGMGGGGMGAGGTHGSMQSPGSGPHSIMGQGMVDNMATMSHVTNEMHQMVTQGKMTQEQQRQMMDMMNQMGTMMQQMAGPKGRSMEKEHTNKLHEMEKRLQTMKDQMAKQ